MGLEITRKKDGTLRSKYWYGRFEVNGQTKRGRTVQNRGPGGSWKNDSLEGAGFLQRDNRDRRGSKNGKMLVAIEST